MARTVSLLMSAQGEICSVWGDAEKCRERAAHFNANPFNDDGVRDPGVPYVVSTWGLCDEEVR